MLDAVEQQGEHYTIVRRGKAVAHLEPVGRGRGDQIKAVLARHDPDPTWAEDLDDTRALLPVEERR